MSETTSPAGSATLDRRINDAELALKAAHEELTRLRAERPAEEVKDYILTGKGGVKVSLGELFGETDDLIVIHNMGRSCPFCTLWADEFNGVLGHLQNRASFVVSSPDSAEVQAEFAAQRGWGFEMISTEGTDFARDLGFFADEGDRPGPWPGVSTFRREEGRIVRIASAFFGPGDPYCGVWHLLALLQGGAGDWKPKFDY
jgi:predicted dithiol-disulfide oxidoreductase (DUF899 family)